MSTAQKDSQQPEALPIASNQIILEGHINCVRSGMAYLTLMDESRISSFAECSLDILKVDGITSQFQIIIQRPGGLILRVGKKERLLHPGEWGHIRETLEAVLSRADL